MSAIGESIAIISLGLSCQTSRQIDDRVPLLRDLTGDRALEKASLPFDWLISSASGLKGMLEDGCFFPETHHGFVADQDRLRLRAHDILFWHESRQFASGRDPRFEDSKAKFRFTSARFERIANLDRVVAVVSDTQPNLPWKQENWNIRLIDHTPEEIGQTRAALERYLGRRVDLLMVSRTPRPDFVQRPDFAYYHMVPEEDGWAGNGRHWTAVWQDYFGPRTLRSIGQPSAETQPAG